MYTITGKPSEEALARLIESLLNFIIENELYEESDLTVSGTKAETVSK